MYLKRILISSRISKPWFPVASRNFSIFFGTPKGALDVNDPMKLIGNAKSITRTDVHVNRDSISEVADFLNVKFELPPHARVVVLYEKSAAKRANAVQYFVRKGSYIPFNCELNDTTPTAENVEYVVKFLKQTGSTAVIAFGGSGVISIGRIAAAVSENGPELLKHRMSGDSARVPKFPSLPFLAIPTCASGLELARHGGILFKGQAFSRLPIHKDSVQGALIDSTLFQSLSDRELQANVISGLLQAIEAYTRPDSAADVRAAAWHSVQLFARSYRPLLGLPVSQRPKEKSKAPVSGQGNEVIALPNADFRDVVLELRHESRAVDVRPATRGEMLDKLKQLSPWRDPEYARAHTLPDGTRTAPFDPLVDTITPADELAWAREKDPHWGDRPLESHAGMERSHEQGRHGVPALERLLQQGPHIVGYRSGDAGRRIILSEEQWGTLPASERAGYERVLYPRETLDARRRGFDDLSKASALLSLAASTGPLGHATALATAVASRYTIPFQEALAAVGPAAIELTNERAVDEFEEEGGELKDLVNEKLYDRVEKRNVRPIPAYVKSLDSKIGRRWDPILGYHDRVRSWSNFGIHKMIKYKDKPLDSRLIFPTPEAFQNTMNRDMLKAKRRGLDAFNEGLERNLRIAQRELERNRIELEKRNMNCEIKTGSDSIKYIRRMFNVIDVLKKVRDGKTIGALGPTGVLVLATDQANRKVAGKLEELLSFSELFEEIKDLGKQAKPRPIELPSFSSYDLQSHDLKTIADVAEVDDYSLDHLFPLKNRDFIEILKLC